MRLGLLLSAALGLAISSGSPAGLTISILAPVIWLRQRSRRGSYLCAVAYYLFALQSLPVVSRNFFGPESGLPSGICLWIVAASMLPLPWLWAWSPLRSNSWSRCPIALLATVVPPLGLIGWASPAAAAGLIFPGTGYVGFALTLLLPGIIISGAEEGIIGLLGLTLLLHLIPAPSLRMPNGWEAISTNFGPVAHEQTDILREYQIGREIYDCVVHSRARVIIFPEAVTADWTGELFRDVPKIVLLGAIGPQRTPFNLDATLAALKSSPSGTESAETANHKNQILIRGARTGEFVQRVPIPIGMWRPYTQSGVPLNLSGPGTISIAGQQAAIIICYEQLIGWPMLASFLEKPSVIVAVSNNVWVAGTKIPKVEQTLMRSWAALFHVPILFAENS